MRLLSFLICASHSSENNYKLWCIYPMVVSIRRLQIEIITVSLSHSFLNITLIIMCMGVLPTCMSFHHMLAWCFQRPEEGFEFPETKVIDGCELPFDCWELNLGLREE